VLRYADRVHRIDNGLLVPASIPTMARATAVSWGAP
jgi:hypothetical protein